MTTALLNLTSAAGSASGEPPFWLTFVPMLLILAVFYLLLIRPQQQQMKAHREKIAAVKRGDEVVTGGGLVGKVIKVEEVYVQIDLGNGQKVRAVKSTLSDIIETKAQVAND